MKIISVQFARIVFDNGTLIILTKENPPQEMLKVGQKVSIRKIEEKELGK